MKQRMRPLLGAHVPVAGGLYKGVEHGEVIGAECIQFFGASPRSYAAALPSVEMVQRFKERLKESGIRAVYQHGAYLVNLGSEDASVLRRSIANLTAHLAIANLIGSHGVIFHVGSPNGGDRRAALLRAASAMEEVLAQVNGPAQLVMENSGSSKKIGGSIEDLAFLFEKTNDSRVKVCIDTAHSFESGLIDAYTPQKVKMFFDAWDAAIGIQNIVAIHMNDSKTPQNSQNDKHENIGEGFIGMDGFRALATEQRIAHCASFLEVPGFDGSGSDKKNMDRLKECFGVL